jgi:hypothetical protein
MIRDQNAILYQEFNSLIIQRDLTMAGEMLQMRPDDWCPLSDYILHDSLLIVGNSFALNDADRPFWTGPDTCTKTIAEEIADKPGLSIDELKSSLRAVRDTLTTSRAFGIIDTDYFPFH